MKSLREINRDNAPAADYKKEFELQRADFDELSLKNAELVIRYERLSNDLHNRLFCEIIVAMYSRTDALFNNQVRDRSEAESCTYDQALALMAHDATDAALAELEGGVNGTTI